MTDEEREQIARLLGLHILPSGKRRRWSYRNKGLGMGIDHTLNILASKGFVHAMNMGNGYVLYRVTNEGISKAGFDGRVRREDRI